MKTASVYWLRDSPNLDLAALAARLPAEEQAELARFRDPQRRRSFILSRALLRHALSPQQPATGRDLRFRRTASGRLVLAATGPWQFSLSHAPDLVAVIVAEAGCGVDIETPRTVPALKLARRYFSTSEQEWLAACGSERQSTEFLRLWTLKEATVKALGQGLAGNLARLAFSLAEEPPRLLDATVAIQLRQIHHEDFLLVGAVASHEAVQWQVQEVAATSL